MKKKLQTFFYGRYGNDQLGVFLSVCSMIFYLLYFLSGFELCLVLAMTLVFGCTFRVYSRNISQRQRENQKYLRYTAPYLDKLNLFLMSRKDRAHRYFTCPFCGQRLRVPSGKGNISVRCTRCRKSFMEKS